jgi:hypothetical protein
MRALAVALLLQWFVVGLSFAENNPAPVLVELFTSEGCSSCPPADALLRQLDSQPISGVQLIVLSEHVDYWNHIGWKDPYSSQFFSQRQNSYAQRMGSSAVYTPQMIVDGTAEFVGSDSKEAQKAIERSRAEEKLSITTSDLTLTNGMLHGRIEIPAGQRAHTADIYLAIALNHAESQVLRGENEGRKLQHVAVVQSLTKIGSVTTKDFSQQVSVKLQGNPDPANLRVIVFVQVPDTGRILGATLNQLKPQTTALKSGE